MSNSFGAKCAHYNVYAKARNLLCVYGMFSAVLDILRSGGRLPGDEVPITISLWRRYKRLHAKLVAGELLGESDQEQLTVAFIHGIRGRRVVLPDDSVKYVTGAYAKGDDIVLHVGVSADEPGDLTVDGTVVTVL